MLFDMLTVLKRRKESCSFIESEIDKIRSFIEFLSNKKSNKKDHSNEITLPIPMDSDETPLLKVTVEDPSGKPYHELFYVGQYIQTPMGEGKIIQLRPKSKSVVLELSFGKMYSAIGRIVKWAQRSDRVNDEMKVYSSFDKSSDESLIHNWDELKKANHFNVSQSFNIKDLLKSSGGYGLNGSQMGADGDATDNDDDLSTVDSMNTCDADFMDIDNTTVGSLTDNSPAIGSLANPSLLDETGASMATASPHIQSSHMVSRSQALRNAMPPTLNLPAAATSSSTANANSSSMVLSHVMNSSVTFAADKLLLPVGLKGYPLAFAPPGNIVITLLLVVAVVLFPYHDDFHYLLLC